MIRLLSIILVLICSKSAFSQIEQSKVIYSGLQDATSIYATQDHLFVVESGKHRLLKLDHDGNLIETLGGLGSGDYQFDRPVDVDATNGLKIYVSDYGNNRIQIYDRRFQYLGSITGETAFQNRRMKPTQLVVNDFGELFVYDESSKSILKFDENGDYRDNFEINGILPEELNIEHDRIEMINFTNQKIALLTQNGILGEIFPIQKGELNLVDATEHRSFLFKLYPNKIERVKND